MLGHLRRRPTQRSSTTPICPTDLLDRELVERFVLVEGIDHVVPVGTDIQPLVTVEPHGISEPHDVQPGYGHALTVVWGEDSNLSTNCS